MTERLTVSVIIPVLDDTAQLAAGLDHLGALAEGEVIVVNGGRRDVSLAALEERSPHVRWLSAPPGRGRQMNAGASQARGEWLLFLHADTRLPKGWRHEVDLADHDPEVVGGSFRLRLDSSRWAARLIERGVAARVRWFNLPYGDQAIFVRRQVFQAMGGYCELPIMEDVELVRRLKRAGRLYRASLAAVTSARRWERDGWLRRSARNLMLLSLYFLGITPQRLAAWYGGGPTGAPDGRRSGE